MNEFFLQMNLPRHFIRFEVKYTLCDISMKCVIWLQFIWPNLGFAGSCEYLLNKSAQKRVKNSEWRMNTQDGSGYEAIW